MNIFITILCLKLRRKIFEQDTLVPEWLRTHHMIPFAPWKLNAEKHHENYLRYPVRSFHVTTTTCNGLSSTIIYTSELILCSTICVPSATRHNIHMYPYFLFAAIHHLKSSPTFSVRPCSSVGRVTVDLTWRSWVRFPLRSKDFFFASCGSLFPFTRANAQWVIHGFK